MEHSPILKEVRVQLLERSRKLTVSRLVPTQGAADFPQLNLALGQQLSFAHRLLEDRVLGNSENTPDEQTDPDNRCYQARDSQRFPASGPRGSAGPGACAGQIIRFLPR